MSAKGLRHGSSLDLWVIILSPLLSELVSDNAINYDALDAHSRLSAGVELIVWSLNRNNSNSSTWQLEELLQKLDAGKDPVDLQVFPPIRNSAMLVSTRPLDYGTRLNWNRDLDPNSWTMCILGSFMHPRENSTLIGPLLLGMIKQELCGSEMRPKWA